MINLASIITGHIFLIIPTEFKQSVDPDQEKLIHYLISQMNKKILMKFICMQKI